MSISSMFFEQLLLLQITKAQKKTVKPAVSFVLLGPTSLKAVRRMLMKLIPGVNFTSVLRAAFMLVDLESVKKYS